MSLIEVAQTRNDYLRETGPWQNYDPVASLLRMRAERDEAMRVARQRRSRGLVNEVRAEVAHARSRNRCALHDARVLAAVAARAEPIPFPVPAAALDFAADLLRLEAAAFAQEAV